MDELLDELCNLLIGLDIQLEELKPRMVLVMSEYEINKKSTELAIYEPVDYNDIIFQRYLISKTVQGLTERTIKAYKTTLLFAFDRIQKQANMVSSDDIKLYLAKRQVKDKVSITTVGNEWSALSAFYGWMQKEELIGKNPMNRVEKPKERKKKKKAFSSLECEQIRNGCITLRDKAIVEILFSTWCRVSEVEAMNIADIKGDEITVLGKGQKERIVYLNAKAQLAVRNYIDSREDKQEALFVSYLKPHDRLGASAIETFVRELGKQINVNNVHPHRFRRTGATMALRSGMPIEKVSYLLGHESIETTQIYLDINDEETKQAHKKYVN